MNPIKSLMALKKYRTVYKRSNDAYLKVMNAIKEKPDEDRVTVKLKGTPEQYEPLFDVLADEGYTFKYEYMEGDLISPGMIFLNIKCKKIIDNKEY